MTNSRKGGIEMEALWKGFLHELEGGERKREDHRGDKVEVVRETTKDEDEKSKEGPQALWTWGDAVGHVF